MTVSRGSKYTFVGVDSGFMSNGTVKLSMDNFVNECIDIYTNKIKKTAATPAEENLFDEDSAYY